MAWSTKKTYQGTKTIVKLTTRLTSAATKATGTAVAAIFSNPISWFVAGATALLLLIVILVSTIFSSNIVQQDEFTLNQSWVQITKRDDDKSTDDVDYKSDIDSILLYMNYRYGGEWEPDATWDDGRGGKIAGFMHFNHFSDALNDIWNHLNKDPDNLKTMPDLYGEKGDVKWIKLSKDEREEYQELLDAQKDVGKYAAMQELESPFVSKADRDKKTKDKKDEADTSKDETVTVIKRYGYDGKKFNTNTTLQAKEGRKLYAAMDGKINVTKDNLKGDKTDTQNIIITADDTQMIYYDVGQIRVKDGDRVEAGDDLGAVHSDSGQTVAYAKKYETAKKGQSVYVKPSMKNYVFTKKKDTESWMLINPGFYWPFVTYSQLTVSNRGGSKTTLTANQVAQKAGISKERAQDAIAIFNHMMGQESSTLQGASAVLSIAERESNLDPTAVNISGGVAGYLQWSGWTSQINGNRWTNAPSRTLDSKTELALLHKELSSSHQHVRTYLQSAKDAGEAALYFSEQYEGVTLSDGQTKAEKLKSDAKKWVDIFKGSLRKSGLNNQGSGPGGTKASSYNFLAEYKDRLKWSQPSANTVSGYSGNNYPVGQCTFYVKNRVHETWGIDVDNYLGNGQDWANNLTGRFGWRATKKPEVGAVCSTAGGFDTTMALYGHVSFVEAVNDDRSFLVSELNYAGNQTQVHWRVINNASYYSFAMPPGH